MNDPTLIILRIFQLTFVPLMLTAPIILVLCMLGWSKNSSNRTLVRAKITQLAVATFLCICGWLAFLVTAFLMRSPMMQLLSTMAWLPFFPLWFLGAMPIAKLLFAQESSSDLPNPEKRTASLVNRQRKNPIRWWHWGLSFTVGAALLVATLIAGQYIDRSTWLPQKGFLWFWGMIGYALLLILTFVIMQFAIRASLNEPEPLDSQGNPQLQRLYDDARSSRILGLFWLLGFLQPLFLGICLLLWTSIESPYLTAILGATGGTLIGLAGSWMGVNATLQRLKITRLKMDLDAGANSTAATN